MHLKKTFKLTQILGSVPCELGIQISSFFNSLTTAISAARAFSSDLKGVVLNTFSSLRSQPYIGYLEFVSLVVIIITRQSKTNKLYF